MVGFSHQPGVFVGKLRRKSQGPHPAQVAPEQTGEQRRSQSRASEMDAPASGGGFFVENHGIFSS